MKSEELQVLINPMGFETRTRLIVTAVSSVLINPMGFETAEKIREVMFFRAS